MLTIGEAPHLLGYVAAAAIVCLLASWAAFSAIGRAAACGRFAARDALLIGAATGFGVWSTHFIAMLGLRPDFPLAFSAPETFASILPAIGLAGGGLALAARARDGRLRLVFGAMSGVGVSAMHHLGMIGLSNCVLTFEPVAVAVATFGSALCGALAMRAVSGRRPHATTLAAGLFSLGVVVLHFGSVVGTGFAPGPPKAYVISQEALSGLQVASSLVLAIPFAMFTRRVVAHAREAQLTGEVAMATGEGVAILDPEGRPTWANEALLAMYDLSAETVIGASSIDLVRRYAEPVAAAAYAEAVARGAPVAIDLAGRDGGEERRWAQIRLIPRRGADGTLTSFVTVHRDITAEKRALRQLEKSRAEARRLAIVAEYATDAILISDEEGRATWVNPAFVRLTGYSLDEIRGRKPGDFLQGPETDPVAVAELGLALRERRPAQVEILNYTRGGTPYWIELAIAPVVREGEAFRFIAVSRDMTERVRRERALVEMRRRAEEADLVKSEFLARMSHEIRTPMNGVMGLTALLSATELDERQGALFAELRRSSERLMRLVDDIMDFSAIEEDRIVLRKAAFDLRALAEETVAAFHPQARAKGLEIGCEVGEEVGATYLGDEGRLRQVMRNLLSNAVAFTEAGEIQVRVRRLGAIGVEGSEERLCVEVSDTGVGLPPEAQAMIFERFRQAEESSRRTHEGAGLGLSIVRSIIERMGGEVSVSSAPGAGSTFRVSFVVETVEKAVTAA